MFQQDSAVDGHVVHSLLGLVFHHVEEMLRPHGFHVAVKFFEHLVNGDRSDGNW